MSPRLRLRLMFSLTCVTVGVVVGIARGWFSRYQQQQKQLAGHIDRTKRSCTLLQKYIRNAVYRGDQRIEPSEIGGHESILPILSTYQDYMMYRTLIEPGAKEQSGLLIDPWGNPLDCKPRGEGEPPDVWSYGPDGENGTEDDIHGKFPEAGED